MKLLLAAVLAGLLMMHRSLGEPALEGAWDVRVRPKRLIGFSRKDRLIFDRGRMISRRWLSDGFLPSGYNADEIAAGLATWEASLSGDDGSVARWAGRIEGDRIKGTLVVRLPDGRVSEYSFKGRRL